MYSICAKEQALLGSLGRGALNFKSLRVTSNFCSGLSIRASCNREEMGAAAERGGEVRGPPCPCAWPRVGREWAGSGRRGILTLSGDRWSMMGVALMSELCQHPHVSLQSTQRVRGRNAGRQWRGDGGRVGASRLQTGGTRTNATG